MTRRTTRLANLLRWMSAVLLAAGLLLSCEQLYLRAKAQLAALLLDRALVASLHDGMPHRPWPWADLTPVARLYAPRLQEARVVLDSAAGSAMAFGLGHVDGTASLGTSGNIVLAGHRDSWAKFFGALQQDDELVLTSLSGARHYRVRALRVVDRSDLQVLSASAEPRLTLVTCYPFGALLPTRQRYVVIAVLDETATP